MMGKRLVGVGDIEIQSMVDRAISGDRNAAVRLVEGITPVLRIRITRALSRRRGEARGRMLRPDIDDLVQDTLAALFADRGRALRAWDPRRGLSFVEFVGFLAERAVARRMRTRKRNPLTEDPTADVALQALAGPTDAFSIMIEAREQVRRLFARVGELLSPRGLRYFQLLMIDERPVRSVAEETGASTESLYAWRSRVTRLLRAQAELDATS
jgi:DNA-directed RNA polymerase specialized sigma24 family protein